MIALSEDFIAQKFFELGYYPKYNRYNNTYQCSCPICHEGQSLGRKRRCYYIPRNNNIYCHNCGWSSTPFNWILEVSGISADELINEIKEYTPEIRVYTPVTRAVATVQYSLPKDCINLFDEQQIEFYSNNQVVQKCLDIVRGRRLNTAINRPDSLYISLADKVHKNRLVIPFYNEHLKIEFYQTRSILDIDIKTRPKYLSKINSEKTLFNIDKVTADYSFVYIFEGPINAFFTKNSVAVAGITERGRSFTERQQQQLDNTLKFYDKIWILDSQWVDRASLVKSEVLLKQGERLFIWPEPIGKRFKDFNDIAVKSKKDVISHDFIHNNTFDGIKGIVKLSEIKRYLN